MLARETFHLRPSLCAQHPVSVTDISTTAQDAAAAEHRSASQIHNLARQKNTRSRFSLTRSYVNAMQRALGQWWPIGRYRQGGLLIRKCKVGHLLTPESLCKQCGRDARDSPNHSLNSARCCCHRQTVTSTRLDTAAVYAPHRLPGPPRHALHSRLPQTAWRHMEKQASRQFTHTVVLPRAPNDR